MLPLAALALVGLARAAARATELQPKTYASPSGRWSLRVEPEERSGTKGAEYVLTGGEREAWRKTQPFTLWDAVVTDDGRVAGYAYSGKEEQAWSGGTLRVVLLSPTGEVVLDEAHEREGSTYEHATGIPRAVGLFAQPELGRFVVRVSRDEWETGEEWRLYELAGGKPLGLEHPKARLQLDNAQLVAVRALPGTPLVLSSQTLYEPGTGSGVRFRLIDERWRVVWERALPGDLAAGGDEREQDRLRRALWSDGAVLATAPGRFELRFVAENARVTFGVERAGDSWKVSELVRTPFAALAATAPTALPTRALALSRRVPLSAAPAPGVEIRDIDAFGFDDRSRLRFVRREGAGVVSLVALDENGAVRRATRVTPLEGAAGEAWFPLPGERWIAAAETYGKAPTRLRIVQESDGAAREIPGVSGWQAPSFHARDARGMDVKRVEVLGAEALVLLGTWSTEHTSSAGLLAFDLDGGVLWSVEEDYEDETKLFSPEDMAVTTDGRVVVLENVRNVLQVYSSKGEYQQTVALAKLWGHEPSYPSGIHADKDGGVLVNDFEGEPPLYRMTREFALAASFDARRGDGSALDEYRRFAKVAPDGRMWTTDRHEFLRLDDAGRVDLELGSPERVDELTDPGFACVESLFGRVLIHDQRSHAVHVFDGEGKLVTLCRPRPEEREKLDHPMALAVAPDGRVVVAESTFEARAICFSATGGSLGSNLFKASNLAFTREGDIWGDRGGRVERLSPALTTVLRLDKRPDGRWLRQIDDLAVAADGALAVLDGPARGDGWIASRVRDDEGRVVALFDAHGAPERVLPLPPTAVGWILAYQGGRLLLNDWNNAFLVDPRDGTTTALTLVESACAFGLSPDGGELWAVEKGGRSLLRYALDP